MSNNTFRYGVSTRDPIASTDKCGQSFATERSAETVREREVGLEGERDDRRVRRTRRLLRDALVALILEKGYDRVTVQDVLDRADVGRATFYAHFRDKDDLLVSGFEELRESLRQQLAKFTGAQADPLHLAEGLELTRVRFEHADDNRRLYQALVGKRGAGVIFRYAHEELASLLNEHFADVVAHRGLQLAVPPDVMVQYLVSALLGLLTWWLDNQMPYTADEMSRAFRQVTHSGVAGVLGEGGGLVTHSDEALARG